MAATANRMEGEVDIYLGRNFVLKLTNRAMALFSQHTNGTSVDEFFETTRTRALAGFMPRNDHLATLLWSCLQHTHRLLTIENVYELMEAAEGDSAHTKVLEISKKLREAYMLASGMTPAEVDRLNKEAEARAKKAAADAVAETKEAGGATVPPQASSPESSSA